MIRSKAIHFKEKERSTVGNWWYNSPMSDWWHKFTWIFRKRYLKVKKLIQWQINVFNNDFDFDGHSLFAIIEYKLKRIEPVLINGHAIQEDEDMHALRLAIKLAGRLKEDDYDEPFWKRHDRKWGEAKRWFEPIPGSKNFTWESSRPNVKTPEDKIQEQKEHLAYIYAADAKRAREEKWLYAILHKYLRRWWD